MKLLSYKKYFLIVIGSFTYGCCCDSTLDSKCENLNVDKSTVICGDPIYRDWTHGCRWSGMLERWMTSKGFSTVTFHDRAVGGLTSPGRADIFGDSDGNIFKNLSASDVICIDHSTNDAMSYFGIAARLRELEKGLESLVRRILHFSIEGSWPTIILLEQYPFCGAFYNECKVDPATNISVGNYCKSQLDYSDVYVRVASKFRLPLWSFRFV